MKQRLSQPKLQRMRQALQELIASVHDARTRYPHCNAKPGQLSGTARFVRDLLALPHTADYQPFEVQLKRRLVRARHRVFGVPAADKPFALVQQLPFAMTAYEEPLRNFDEASRELLRALSDVDIAKNHQHQRSVKQLLA